MCVCIYTRTYTRANVSDVPRTVIGVPVWKSLDSGRRRWVKSRLAVRRNGFSAADVFDAKTFETAAVRDALDFALKKKKPRETRVPELAGRHKNAHGRAPVKKTARTGHAPGALRDFTRSRTDF